MSKQSALLKEMAITQTNDQKNIQNFRVQLATLDKVTKSLNQLNDSNNATEIKLGELSNNLLMLEETVQAFDSYRKQNNELMQELQLQISTLTPIFPE